MTADYYFVPTHQSFGNHNKESKDEYCRRKDRYYEQLADQLLEKKRERDGVKALLVLCFFFSQAIQLWSIVMAHLTDVALQDGTRNPHHYRKWKREHERLCDRVELLKRSVDHEMTKVLRRHPM